MAEISVKNPTCRHCGADVRPDTQFCYNCGGAIAPDAAAVVLTKENAVNSPLRENTVESVNGNFSKQTNKLDIADVTGKPIEKPEVEKEVELKSAASMRRKSKIIPPKKVEVIWEEHENAPNVWFILVAVILTIFAAVVMYLAMILK
jgi:hypothetical protein